MRIVLTAAWLLSLSPAFADELLYSDKSWTMTKVSGADGQVFCRSSATNDDGTTLTLEGRAGGEIALAFSDDDWGFPAEETDDSFGIRINAFELIVFDAVKSGNRISAGMTRLHDEYYDLVEAMTNGTSLTVESAKGSTVTRFSLDGAAATLEAQFACEDALGS